MIRELVVVCALALTADAQSGALDTDTALYILCGILGISALVCLLLVIGIAVFCWKLCLLRLESNRERGTGKVKKGNPKSLRLFTGHNRNEVAAAGNENVQLKHLLSINSDTSEGVSTPQYDATLTFKPVIENKVVVVEGDFETQFNVASSKPSLTSTSEVAVAVPETQEGFEARKEKAKMLRQQSLQPPPNPCSLLRDETEVNYNGLSRRDSVSYQNLPGVCAVEEGTIHHSRSEGHLDSQPAGSKENSLSETERWEQFVSQKDSAKRNRKGKRVLESRDSAQPLLAPTPCSESEKPAFPEFPNGQL